MALVENPQAATRNKLEVSQAPLQAKSWTPSRRQPWPVNATCFGRGSAWQGIVARNLGRGVVHGVQRMDKQRGHPQKHVLCPVECLLTPLRTLRNAELFASGRGKRA